MYTITTCLTNSIKMIHRSLAVTVYPDTTHKIMLCRDNRYPLFQYIIALFHTSLINVREMIKDRLFINILHRKPDMIGSVFFHLCLDCFRNNITWKKLIYKTFSVLIIENRTFSTYRFRNQKSSSRFFGIKSGRMNLNIVKML